MKRNGTTCPLQWFKNNKFLNTYWWCMTYTTPIVSSSKKMNNVNMDLVTQEPVESITSWQWRATTVPYESASSWGPRRSQRISKSIFLMTMKSMLVKKFKWRVIPHHLKKPWEAFTRLNGKKLWKLKWIRWIPTMFET